MSPVLQMCQVSKSYRLGSHLVQALTEIDLALTPGEMLALTGPSGSGKSTLLNLAGLIDRPDTGTVTLLGEPLRQADEVNATHRRRHAVGFVFQGFNLVPVMSVAENVDYPLWLLNVPRAQRRQRVGDILAAVGLADHAHHLPDALSGGQRQRVALARALVKRPPLIIADEPTASLDSGTADQIVTLMRDCAHTQGTALLIASHDDRLVRRCDRALTLRDGRLTPPTPCTAAL